MAGSLLTGAVIPAMPDSSPLWIVPCNLLRIINDQDTEVLFSGKQKIQDKRK